MNILKKLSTLSSLSLEIKDKNKRRTCLKDIDFAKKILDGDFFLRVSISKKKIRGCLVEDLEIKQIISEALALTIAKKVGEGILLQLRKEKKLLSSLNEEQVGYTPLITTNKWRSAEPYDCITGG
jgi:hypothetical protein